MVSSPLLEATTSLPVLSSMKHPVPYVFLAEAGVETGLTERGGLLIAEYRR